MRALALVMTAATLAIVACGEEPTAPSFTPSSVELCQRPKTIDTDFRQGDTIADKTLALTFDDGPSEITSELSTYLKGQGIAATFFVNGANFPGFENAVQQIAADGHLIGNHTQTHSALTKLASVDVVREVEQTDALIKDLVPPGKLYFRPPFGDWSPEVQRAVASSAMNKYQGPIGWDIGDHMGPDSAADWDCWSTDNGAISVAECGALYLKEIRAKKKGIVLLHDGPPGGEGAKTLEMVKAIVPTLKKDGYRFVRIDAAPTSTGAGTGSAAGGDPCAQR